MNINIARQIAIVALAVGLMCAAAQAASAAVAVFEDRVAIINFEGKLVDADGLAYDGTADVEAWFYRAPTQLPADLVYAEEFPGVAVEYGLFRVPFFSGSPLEGTVFSLDAIAATNELYADIKINGVTFLASHPMRASLAAIRAERAKEAESVRLGFVVDKSAIPDHSAYLITSGDLDPNRLPTMSASGKITSGTFPDTQLPSISADSITIGQFTIDQMPSQVDVSKFSDDELLDSVITDEVIRTDDIAFEMGTSGNNGYIDVPEGFMRNQCKILLGLREIDGHSGVDQFHIAARPTGEVECRWSWNEMGTQERGCTVNYLMVCKR